MPIKISLLRPEPAPGCLRHLISLEDFFHHNKQRHVLTLEDLYHHNKQLKERKIEKVKKEIIELKKKFKELEKEMSTLKATKPPICQSCSSSH